MIDSEEPGRSTGWSGSTIGEVAQITRRPRGLSSADVIPFVPMAMIPESGDPLTSWETRPTDDVKSGIYFESGDVLLSKITPCLENGKQALVRDVPGGWGMATTEVFPLKALSVTSDFLDLYLRTPSVRADLAGMMQGTTGRQRLPRQALNDYPIPVPPFPEQRAITRVLRTVQQAREATEQVIDAARELRRSLMRHQFKEEWETKPLGDIARIERGKFSHRPRNDPAFYGGDTPFIQTGDVTESDGSISSFTQTLNESGLSVSRVFPAGTIVITIAANIGYTGILEFDSAFPDSLIGITPDEMVNNTYLNYYLTTQQSEMDRLAPRGTQKNINIQFLKPWPVPVPPLSEQKKVVAVLGAVDGKIRAEVPRRDALDSLFVSLLSELMSGQIRVPESMWESAA